jgi:hypothetical protein
MKTRKLLVIVAFVCLMAFLSVSTFAQTDDPVQPDLGGSLAEVLAQMLAAEGYDVKLDGNKLTIGDRIMLEMPSTLEESEDNGFRAHLVPQVDNFTEDQAEDIEDLLQLRNCLNAADLLFKVNQALCELNQVDVLDFLCKTSATFERVLSSLKCVALYVEQEPPSGPVVSVFVTGRRYGGNLRGLAGADRKCQRRAEAADLSGTWTAWLSDSTENAFDRIPDGQYQLLDGTQVADDKADLTDGFLNAAINLDEFGNQRVGFAWTGTEPGGTDTGNNCNGWTNNSSQFGGDRGVTDVIDSEWTQLNATPAQCSERYRLYCFGEGVE